MKTTCLITCILFFFAFSSCTKVDIEPAAAIDQESAEITDEKGNHADEGNNEENEVEEEKDISDAEDNDEQSSSDHISNFEITGKWAISGFDYVHRAETISTVGFSSTSDFRLLITLHEDGKFSIELKEGESSTFEAKNFPIEKIPYFTELSSGDYLWDDENHTISFEFTPNSFMEFNLKEILYTPQSYMLKDPQDLNSPIIGTNYFYEIKMENHSSDYSNSRYLTFRKL